jgi:Ran GTPase-activating protein (RanGAP) involved in mRNA processing and transport
MRKTLLNKMNKNSFSIILSFFSLIDILESRRISSRIRAIQDSLIENKMLFKLIYNCKTMIPIQDIPYFFSLKGLEIEILLKDIEPVMKQNILERFYNFSLSNFSNGYEISCWTEYGEFEILNHVLSSTLNTKIRKLFICSGISEENQIILIENFARWKKINHLCLYDLDKDLVERILNQLKVNKALRVLYIIFSKKDENQIFFSTTINEIQGLKELDLSYNSFENCEKEELNNLIRNNKSFKILSLNHCALLDNDIEMIFQTLADKNIIEKLNMKKNYFTSEGLKFISIECKSIQKLKHLSLSKNVLTGAGSFIGDIIYNAECLTILKLNNIQPTIEDCQFIFTSLKRNNSLTKLSLRSNRISSESCKFLYKGLKRNNGLNHLNMKDNLIGSNGCEWISLALKINSTLLNLELTSNGILDKGIKLLTDSLKINRSLKRINLEKNSFTIEGTMCLIESLLFNRSIVDVTLQDMTEKSVEMLEKVLHNNSIIKSLEIYWGSYTGKLPIICNSSLKKLKVSNKVFVAVKEPNVKFFSKSFNSNILLQELTLTKLNLTHKGIEYISKSLICECYITKLDLSDNPLGDLGLLSLSSAMNQNFTLETLGLRNIGLNTSGLNAFYALIHSLNAQMKILDIQKNGIQEEEIYLCVDKATSTKLNNIDIKF